MSSPARDPDGIDPNDVAPLAPRPWLSAPALAHKAWRDSLELTTGGRHALDTAGTTRSYASHSTAMYTSLFGRFCQWLAGNRLNLGALDADQLTRFVGQLEGRDGAEPSIRTRRMYLGEIERVLAHLASIGLRTDNPASELIQMLRLREPLPSRAIALPPPGFNAALKDALTEMSAADGAPPREVRNAACVALMSDAGLTVKELQKLRVRHFRYPGYPANPPLGDGIAGARIHAPGHRLLRARDLDLSPWVAELVGRWLLIRRGEINRAADVAVRRRSGASRKTRVASDPAFAEGPAVPRDPESAKLFVDGIKARALQADTVHRATVAVCLGCGAQEGAAGPQALRNEYLAKLVRNKTPPLRAAYLAGLADSVQLSEVARVLRSTASPAEGNAPPPAPAMLRG